MKKVIIILMIAISVILLVSCGQNVGTQLTRLDELKLQYDQVGVQHNFELDKMLSIYQSQPEILDRSTCEKLADEYIENSGDVAMRIMDIIGNKSQLSKALSNADVISALADSIEVFGKYPEIFSKMSDILDSELELKVKVEQLEKIFLLVDEEVDDEEDRECLMNGLSTTIHSIQYWHENYEEWQDVLNPSMAKSALSLGAIVGISDGAGAVVGTFEGLRDTYKGQDQRFRIILGRVIGEAAKTSLYIFIGSKL